MPVPNDTIIKFSGILEMVDYSMTINRRYNLNRTMMTMTSNFSRQEIERAVKSFKASVVNLR